MISKIFTGWVLCLLGAAVMSCASADPGTADPEGIELGQASLPIINGVPATEPHHGSVVSLHRKLTNGSFSTNIFCSGTLIAPNVVLTAAHCLDVANGGPTFKTLTPSSVAVYFGSDPTSASQPFASNHRTVSKTLINPAYDRQRLLNDLGLLRLTSAGPATAVPALPSAQGFTASDIGTDLDFAGFGYSNTDPKSGINVKLHAIQPLGGLGCTVAGCPSSSTTNPTALITQISYTQDPEGPCNGDSGGPAFIQRGSSWFVGAVTSYGDSACTIYGASTRADSFESWINTFIHCSADGTCNATCSSDPDCAPVVPVCGASDGICPSGCTNDVDCVSACYSAGAVCTTSSQCCSKNCKGGATKTCR